MADNPYLTHAHEYYTGKFANTAFQLYNPTSVSSDALTSKQWHLQRLGDMNAVWADYTGKGVHVGVYDSGVDKPHWDLDGNYDASREVTIGGVKIDGQTGAEPHGTAVAGLIAAERNSRGGVGVAYGASVTGVPILKTGGSPVDVNTETANYLKALAQATTLFDVSNHSYGAPAESVQLASGTSRGTVGTYGYAVAQIMDDAATYGRNGLGALHVWAAGNSATDGQALGLNTDRHAISVAAYREVDGAASNYSNSGAHVLVSAPSSDTRSIGGTGPWTTDILGDGGYNLSMDPSIGYDYTDSFGGTSGAAPIVTGVVSLMLDANENLGWRDVRNILAASAKMPVAFDMGPLTVAVEQGGELRAARLNEDVFHLSGQSANWNGGAMHFSNDYGYGAVDAYNAVRMAEVWGLFGTAKTSANEAHVTYQGAVNISTTASFADYTPSGFQIFGDFINTPTSVTFELGDNIDIEHIDLSLNFDAISDTQLSGDITGKSRSLFRTGLAATQFKLIAPDGTEGFIGARGALARGVDQNSTSEEFTFGFSGFHGVESKGTWTLEMAGYKDVLLVYGFFPFETFTNLLVKNIKMDVYGSTPTMDDVHTYTNEFFAMKAIAGESGRAVLNDVNGGDDWINAAAVSSDVNVSLVGGQSTTFGGQTAFTIGRTSVIENVVTGDGNDTLIGNRFDNFLVGMRGNDTLNGGAGNDWLLGGTGNDKFLFDNKGTSGKDLMLDFNRGDLIGTQTALRGVSKDGTVTVAANTLLLLDGTRTGDTAQLSERGGAVLQVAGQKDGYFWYNLVSGTDIKMGDAIREASFQSELTGAGMVEALAAMGATNGSVDAVTGGHELTGAVGDHGGFYLYDAMAGSMSGGVLLQA